MSDGYNEKGICKLCGQGRTSNGHDPCIANLPGVLFACCGHGCEDGYVKFVDGRCLTFKTKKVTLDTPTAYVERKKIIPGFKTGEKYRVFKFKKGKVKTNKMKYGIDSVD